MSAGIYNITADQGATFDQTITWKDSAGVLVNLTGYTARMDIRETITSSTPALQLTTANSRIVLGGASGTVRLTVSAADMAALPAGQYVYDLELVSSTGIVTRLIQGDWIVPGEVTR